MYILITGVAGFIGSNFVYQYLNTHKDHTLIGFDALTYAGNLENLKEILNNEKRRFIFVKGDITDPDSVRSALHKWPVGASSTLPQNHM